MLSVSNTTTWENYFKQLQIKNCNVIVYDTLTGTKIIDKVNMSSFTCKSRNCYVPEKAPQDVVTIVIPDWNSLTATQKTQLQSKTYFKIAYVVEGTETTNCKLFYEKDIEFDEHGKKATITLVGIIESDPMTRYCAGASNTSLPYLYQVNGTYPVNITFAEFYQNYAISQGQGFKAKNYVKTGSIDYTYPFDYVTFSTTANGNFSILNVTKDWNIYDADDKSQIEVYGIVAGTVAELYRLGGEYSNINRYRYYEPTIVTGHKVYADGSEVPSSKYTSTSYVGCDEIRITGSGVTYPREFVYYGYVAQLEEIPNDTKYYIQTYTLKSGSTALTTARSRYRTYYGKKQYIEFDCRIDPRFEPLDVIAVDGDIDSSIVLEEVTINFNGAFSGHLKGRII